MRCEHGDVEKYKAAFDYSCEKTSAEFNKGLGLLTGSRKFLASSLISDRRADRHWDRMNGLREAEA